MLPLAPGTPFPSDPQTAKLSSKLWAVESLLAGIDQTWQSSYPLWMDGQKSAEWVAL